MNEKLDKIICKLKGTGRSLYSVCKEMGFNKSELTKSELQYIKSYIFCCPECGRWYDVEEKNNYIMDDICNYCYEEAIIEEEEEYDE